MLPRQRLVLAALLSPVVVVSMELTALYLAVHLISEQLQPSDSELLWIVDIYGFVLAALLIPADRPGDRIGRRRILMLGLRLWVREPRADAPVPLPLLGAQLVVVLSEVLDPSAEPLPLRSCAQTVPLRCWLELESN